MKQTSRIVNSSLLGALLALPYPAAARTLHSSTGASAALIVKSGNSGTAGYRISVSASGHAEAAFRFLAGRQTTRRHVVLPNALRRRFFNDMAQATPLSRLPANLDAPGDAPDVSMTVRYNGSQSPDLRRASSERGRRLYRDIQQIAQNLRLPIPNTP